MKSNVGLKKYPDGRMVLIHLGSGEELIGINNILIADGSIYGVEEGVHASFFLEKIDVITECYQVPRQPEPKSSGVELQLNIDTQPFRESLRLLGEDLIKMADKS